MELYKDFFSENGIDKIITIIHNNKYYKFKEDICIITLKHLDQRYNKDYVSRHKLV